MRCNIFEEPQESGSPAVPTRPVLRSNSDAPKTPKNRQGRKIRTEPSISHVANYLLNVINENPTCPIVPKNFAIKLSKLNPDFLKIPRLNRKPSRHRQRKLLKNAKKMEIEKQDSNASESLNDAEQEFEDGLSAAFKEAKEVSEA